MNIAAVLGIAFAIGTTVILGIALVSYMSSLARSAYEIKVEMRKDMEDGFKRIEAEVTKQTQWARGDLMAEVERTRAGLLEDLSQRHADIKTALASELVQRQATWDAETEALTAVMTAMENRIEMLEQRLKSRTRLGEPPPQEPQANGNPLTRTLPAEADALPLPLQTFNESVAPLADIPSRKPVDPLTATEMQSHTQGIRTG